MFETLCFFLLWQQLNFFFLPIRYLTNLKAPTGGWKQKLPKPGDKSIAAFVLLARELRNILSHCSLSHGDDFQTEEKFDANMWSRIEDILLGLRYNAMHLFHQLRKEPLNRYQKQQVQCLQDTIPHLATKVEINALKTLINHVQHNIGTTQNRMFTAQLNAIKDEIDRRIAKIEENIERQEKESRQHFQRFDNGMALLNEKINLDRIKTREEGINKLQLHTTSQDV